MIWQEVVLPVLLNVISGAAVVLTKRRAIRWLILVVSVSLLALWLSCVALQQPRLVVVPDLRHRWVDEATNLCSNVGLRAVVQQGTSGERKNEVQKQSLEAGSVVFKKSKIVINICTGEPVGDPLYGVASPEGRKRAKSR